MIKSFIFLLKYKILKDPINLSYHPQEFFQLNKNTQRKVLDQYFLKLEKTFPIDTYFNTKEARYYQDNEEVSFYHCYYFDKLAIELNPNNISLIDKFKLDQEKLDYLVSYYLTIVQEDNLSFNIENLLIYPEKLPLVLSQNIDFMHYAIEKDFKNIKYLVYNEKCFTQQRALIQLSLVKAREINAPLDIFLKKDHTLSKELKNNFDFILYLIENNICYIEYLTEEILNQTTPTSKDLLTKTIITSLKKNPESLKIVEKNFAIATELNENLEFIEYLISDNIQNISYINWQHLPDKARNDMINYLTKKLEENHQTIDIMKYPFYHFFFENYAFMNYLIQSDFRWIAVNQVNEKENQDKLIDLSLKKMKQTNYKFKLEDFLEDGKHMNSHLVENKKMLGYFFQNQVPIVWYINFFQLNHPKNVVENILFFIEKKDYEFHNEEFLVNGKYPIPLSNSYRFMRFCIDKNFNNLAYIDLSMLDKRELKRIINYAFRMVYYIRGNNKKLNFDFEGYFQNSDIIHDQYFQECLKSL